MKKSLKYQIKAKAIKWARRAVYHENVSANWLVEEWLLRDKIKETYHLNNWSLVKFNDFNQIHIGEGSVIADDAWIWCHDNEDDGPYNGCGRGSLKIGEHTCIGSRFHVDCFAQVSIGRECLFADDILILTGNHGSNPEGGAYIDQPLDVGEIVIEDGCWLGSRVTILPGVKVGKKSIIGTNAVVSKDIPPYSMAVGVPARVIKRWSFEKHEWERVDKD